MNPLIGAYQGIFAGTRIATQGFAMATAGLARPKPPGMDVVERPARGMVPIPGQAACGLQPRYMARSKESPPEEILTMPNRSMSDRTPLFAAVILAMSLGIVVAALALLALLFLF